jgi:nitrogen fixation/metabolism regulation signal transduction histidine kinase
MVAMPLPSSLTAIVDDIRAGTRDYWALAQAKRRVRGTYMLLLLLLTALTLFSSSWLALFFSKQITRPIEQLADAMDAIAEGDYRRRLEFVETEELAALVRSFNDMAADLEDSRLKLEFSSTQLSAVNRSLEERRHELETVLETIPSGVATLDPHLRLIHANRAFYETFSICQNPADLPLQPLSDVIADDALAPIARVIRSSQRRGVASSEIELATLDGRRNVAMTAAPLGGPRDPRGYVLVLDNLTDLLRAQKQVAWKEVAQRVAHEIKNPLTPIALSAERIRRHVDRGTAGESSEVIRHCSEVISASVESMRVLVNQFAALAQFPAAQPRIADLNTIVEAAVATFEGRLDGVRIERHYEANLPGVLADPESLKRALTNLIDNAAEAMHNQLHRVLTVETNLVTEHSAEVVIADTGTGLTAEIRDRLFLPFYSTKQRGTGLGLSIAAKIAQEHGGTLRAEQNQPVGARFILEVPLVQAGNSAVEPLNVSVEQPR